MGKTSKTTLSIYLLTREAEYNEYQAMIISAFNTDKARELANDNCSEEGRVWDKSETGCRKLGTSSASKPTVHYSDYNAG